MNLPQPNRETTWTVEKTGWHMYWIDIAIGLSSVYYGFKIFRNDDKAKNWTITKARKLKSKQIAEDNNPKWEGNL